MAPLPGSLPGPAGPNGMGEKNWEKLKLMGAAAWFMACYAMFQSSSVLTAGILFSVAASLDAKLLQDAAVWKSQLQPNLLAKTLPSGELT